MVSLGWWWSTATLADCVCQAALIHLCVCVCQPSNRPTFNSMLRISAHLDEVYTCELGLGGSFAPKPGAAERYKVARFGCPFFQDAPQHTPDLKSRVWGVGEGLGYIPKVYWRLLTEYLLMYRYNGLPFTHRRCLKLPKVNGIAGSGCSSGKAGGDDWTYGGSFPGIMASKIWAEPDVSEPWPVQKVTDWIRLFHLICSGSVDSIIMYFNIYVYDISLGSVYI